MMEITLVGPHKPAERSVPISDLAEAAGKGLTPPER